MGFFSNISIGKKLTIGFGIVLILLAGIALYAVNTASTIDRDYSYMDEYPLHREILWLEVENNFHAIRRSVSHSGFYVGEANHMENTTTLRNEANQNMAAMRDSLNQIRASLVEDERKKEDERATLLQAVDGLIADVTDWENEMINPVLDAFLANDRETALAVFSSHATMASGLLQQILTEVQTSAEAATTLSKNTTIASNNAITFLIVLAAIAIFIGIIAAFLITKAITKPIGRLVQTVSAVADGNLNVNINRSQVSKDEIGQLTAEIIKLIDTILLIVSELDRMSNAFQSGDIEAKADGGRFKGSYQEVINSVNGMTGDIVGEVLTFMGCLSEFGKGNFKADMPKLPGKKAVMNENLETLRKNLTDVSGEINYLVAAALEGKLDRRVEAQKYKGDWAALLDRLNALMKAIAEPIGEAAEILQYVAEGDFNRVMTGDYKGEFLNIKLSVNNSIENIASYIDEISAVLDALSQNNLNQDITRAYVGKFANMKTALLNIIATFNRVIADIFVAADQVAAGSRAISDSSMTLAQGATEQASAIQELNATMHTINEGTGQNANNAKEAETLATVSKKSAATGDEDMQQMLKAMDGIKESSNGISNIIKVIDDIAFQTNLLALNAAVEAARAGEHGKGFAVVAEEVRSLAGRSQSNAHETARMIEESISRVNEGMAIAGKTADALRVIVDSVSKVSEIITGITAASEEQAYAISQVMEGIRQITDVVQNNSATSEETASASEELSSQSDVLKSLVEVFALKA